MLPDGHHLRNRDPARHELNVAEDVQVTSGWNGYDEHGTPDENEAIFYKKFVAAMAGNHERDVRDNLGMSP